MSQCDHLLPLSHSAVATLCFGQDPAISTTSSVLFGRASRRSDVVGWQQQDLELTHLTDTLSLSRWILSVSDGTPSMRS